jgi:demethylmenaquinone methyltransferase/2-methoxy-6-polyprenyl-1,4-benzoquinol methylase
MRGMGGQMETTTLGLVERARQRALAFGFAQSAEPEVGQLLGVLAGGVPPGGRVLEIGTGIGYGTACIVSGLAGRDDVEVVSVEIDAARRATVVADRWPGFVRFIAGDVLAQFDSLGTFDLVFADAQGGKWEGLDRTIDALRPGGLLVVDDMRHPTVVTVPDQVERTAQVRRSLVADPRLQCVELDWSSGVILARRRPGSQRLAVSVRAATADDAPAVRAIAQEAWRETYRDLLRSETIEAFLAGPYALETVRSRIAEHDVLVAELDGDGVAYADAVPEPERLFLAALYARPALRGRGAGSALLAAILERHPGLPIDAYVLDGNRRGEGFYERRGFTPVETIEGDLFGESVRERRWRRAGA